ncbi:replication restart helicase PriA [Solidesulfovibrio alcoholivorans]|uniref:replication restart helicase PriA n=1 Tax=Solidesulfovibrio alcoholivorans TaxID=81406 RepID=UPI0004963D2E|nr:primosomal protein N' [Solidesulfovibrio alcoholivorans]
MSHVLAVVLTSPPYAILSYVLPPGFEPEDFPPGLCLLVPMGGTVRAGMVWEAGVPPPAGVALRPALFPLERAPACDADYLELVRNLASRHLATPGRILATLLPRGMRTSRVEFVVHEAGLPRRLTAKGLWKLPEADRAALAGAWRRGEVRCRLAGDAADPLCALATDPPWPVRPGAARQLAILDALCDVGPMPLSDLKKRCGDGTLPILRRLCALGLVRLDAGEGALLPDATEVGETAAPAAGLAGLPPLTGEQETALAALAPALAAPDGAARLVFGVTGSGKTRLYMELAARTLARGKRVVLLAPEVALAARLHKAAANAFPGHAPLLYHGYQPPAARETAFRRAAGADAPMLVAGTRSALFLPLRDIGLIILDEEHDGAFKQEDRLPYQAKEVAFFRANRAGALLVLGSATPDVKTFYAAREGHVPMVRLSRRVGAGGMPSVALVDMRAVPKLTAAPGTRETGDRAGVLTEEAAAALAETVAGGDQAMILINRRGYAPLLFCLDCETPVRCPHCELSLTYHKDRERLVCHYCGHSRPHPAPCPSCGGTNFLPMGVGAEMLEEQLAGVLPAGAGVARLDRDIARRPERAEAILDDFSSGRARVLVGTQMLSKGHHFPDVTLVVAADADLGRALPDYRASERTFQLLTQLAGRAGRGGRPGRVLIQTRTPGDPFFAHVVSGDFEAFYELELSRRRRLCYPPFTRLGLARLSFPREYEEGFAAVAAVGQAMRQAAAPLGVRVLGPAPAPLALVAGRRRFHCLLKSPDWPAARRVFAAGREALPAPGQVRFVLDLDPVDML